METNANIDEGAAEITRDKLVSDLKVVVRDAEALMKATAHGVGEKAQEAREKLSAALENAKVSMREIEEKALAGAKATDKVIRAHPYESIGIAFGIGLLIGVLVNRGK